MSVLKNNEEFLTEVQVFLPSSRRPGTLGHGLTQDRLDSRVLYGYTSDEQDDDKYGYRCLGCQFKGEKR